MPRLMGLVGALKGRPVGREKLQQARVIRQRMVSDQGLFQLFLLDPNGVKVELNFSNEEAAGIAPELIASELNG